MGIRGEVFSTKVLLQNRTYFFNVKENRLGDLYLNIVESKNRDTGGFERQSVILFADDLSEFLQGFDESLKVLEKAVREKKRSVRQAAPSSGEGGRNRYAGGDDKEGRNHYTGDDRRAERSRDERSGPHPPRGKPASEGGKRRYTPAAQGKAPGAGKRVVVKKGPRSFIPEKDGPRPAKVRKVRTERNNKSDGWD
ncbi:hypothetical protein FACS1894142_1420 [Spirochaetia bacterium]|nr:hypothetical protein FACS1894142_1420 [Spirochaetia bacterium]